MSPKDTSSPTVHGDSTDNQYATPSLHLRVPSGGQTGQPDPTPRINRKGSYGQRIAAAWRVVFRPHTRTINDPGPLRLLCFDGGGVRGLSSLFILKEFLHRVQNNPGFVRPGNIEKNGEILPCEYFDMICGTSTGGLIAIMLGKLRMSVDETIKAYIRLSEDVFSKKKWFWKDARYSAKALEKAICTIIGERAQHIQEVDGTQMEASDLEALGRSIMMRPRGNESETQGCKVFVYALNAQNADAETNIRTYRVMENELDDFAIWEAARATSADPFFFKLMVIQPSPEVGRMFSGIYVDGGLRHSNPIGQLFQEAAKVFPNRPTGFVLSLGTGQRNAIQFPCAGCVPKLQLLQVFNLLRQIAANCEATHQDIGKKFTSRRNIYFRFNVDQGLQDVGLEWRNEGKISAHTSTYMSKDETNKHLREAVNAFISLQSSTDIRKIVGK
ncbi:acyl transferase/acyl hydrolase/lysophospholipase [Rhizoctonia solani]|nr:acyl transferase/acyl hydrolase/lysophospholipase [Rhizoctonia solani]